MPNARLSIAFPGLRITAPPLWLVVVLPLSVFVVDFLNISAFGATTPIWVSNAFAVTALLRNKRSTWPVLLLLTAAAEYAAMAITGTPIVGLGIAACDSSEVLVVATLASFTGVVSPIESIWPIARLALVCVLVPTVSAAAGAGLLTFIYSAPFLPSWVVWYLSASSGLLIFTPLLICWTDQELRTGLWRDGAVRTLVLVGLVGVVSYVQFKEPLPGTFLVFPFLLLATFSGRLLGATTATAILATVAIVSTVHGHGSITVFPGANTVQKVQILQLYIVVVLLSTLPVAAILEQRNKLTTQLQESTKNAQAAVAATRLAERQFAALFTSSVDAIMSKTLDGIVTNLNPAAERLFGYSPRELIGQPIALLLPPDRAYEEMWIMAQIRNGENVENFETIRRCKNGELFHVSISLSLIRDAAGAIIGTSEIARDITEQKLAERELRQHRDHLADLVVIATSEVAAIVQTVVSGIVTFDADGVIDVFNPSAEKLFGWSKAEIAGQNISVLMDAPFSSKNDHDLADFRTTATSNIFGKEQEILARRKDGRIFPAHFSVGHSELSAAKRFFVGSIVDITEQKQTERILQQAKEDAEAGGRAKAAFVANMSHEIRTPMNAILGFAEILLQDTQLPPQAAQHVQIILTSAKALLTLLNDILDVSKLESGKVALEAVAFHLPNALGEALRLVDPQATAKGLNIALEYDAGLPLRYLGDPSRLRQVVLNLVGNALKFTEQGSVTLSVKPAGTADMLHFAITDTGIGMTPRQMAAVFEPFSQADTSTTRRFGGTGLGTTISKQIVELMGGKIWVESEYGRGAAFHFTAHLPAATAGASCLYETAIAIADDHVLPRLFKVLLVEDIAANATLAMLRLRRLGHRVDWCKNGMEAVAAYQAGHYDLILMDIMMPVMNGLDATRAIRKLEQPGARIPIIALTASAMREDYDLCTAAGMDQVQAKPIDFNALLTAMEQAVPAGRGQPNITARTEIAGSASVDFSWLDGIADHRGALANWREPAVYAKALVDFAADHVGDATALETLLRADPHEGMGNAEPARALAHALKGVAGNLGITQLAELAGAIETRLKAGQHEAALAELGQLSRPLAAAVKAIHDFGSHAPPAASMATIFEPAVAVALLGDFSAALEKRNPYSAEPILARLTEYLPETALAPLRQQLDAFNFKGAQKKAMVLAETLARQGE